MVPDIWLLVVCALNFVSHARSLLGIWMLVASLSKEKKKQCPNWCCCDCLYASLFIKTLSILWVRVHLLPFGLFCRNKESKMTKLPAKELKMSQTDWSEIKGKGTERAKIQRGGSSAYLRGNSCACRRACGRWGEMPASRGAMGLPPRRASARPRWKGRARVKPYLNPNQLKP